MVFQANQLVGIGDINASQTHFYSHENISDMADLLGNIALLYIPTFMRTGIHTISHILFCFVLFHLFLSTGHPVIRESQKQSINNIVNLTGVATLFATTAASMLQLSSTSTVSQPSKAEIAVNVLWYNSLLIGIAAAVNNLLIVIWMQAI